MLQLQVFKANVLSRIIQNKENVIFFEHTGKKTKYKDADDFYNDIKPVTKFTPPRDNVYDEAWYQRDKMMENKNKKINNMDIKNKENKKYPISEEEYIYAVQENFKRIYHTMDRYFDMLYDERVINLIKREYKSDCHGYDEGELPDGYFDVNNPVLGNRILPAVELAVEFPEFID